MKKIFCLFLCFVLLFATGCKKALPELDTLGVVSGNTYENAYFGLKFTVPPDYYILTDEEKTEIIDTFYTGSGEITPAETPFEGSYDIYTRVPLFALVPEQGAVIGSVPSLVVYSENLPKLDYLTTKNESAYLIDIRTRFFKEDEAGRAENILGALTKKETEKTLFYTFNNRRTDDNGAYSCDYYAVRRGDHMIVIVAVYADEADRGAFDTLIESVSFGAES